MRAFKPLTIKSKAALTAGNWPRRCGIKMLGSSLIVLEPKQDDFLIIMGNLGNWIGRRRLLLLGATAFGVASVLAAFAPSAELLIVARAVLGVSGACLMPSTLSLIRNMFEHPAERTKAITVWMMSFMIGTVIGPVVGGLLLEWFWWGSVFLLAVPVMGLILMLGRSVLPEHRNENKAGIDLLSAAMALAAILMLVFALKEAARSGVSGSVVLVFGIGLCIGAIFTMRQRRLANPLLDLGLFRYSGFSAALISLTTAIFTIGGSMFLIYQYLQGVLDLTPLKAGCPRRWQDLLCHSWCLYWQRVWR